LNTTATGPVVYSETRTVVTNAFGLFNVQVGGPGASNVVGTIAGVNWSGIGGAGNKYLQVEIDPTGGANFVNVGSTQLLSVPYALTAAGAPPIGPAGGDLTGSYPNPTVAKIRGVNVTTTAPTTNYVLGFNGTDWTPTSLATHPDNYWRLNGTNIYNANTGGNVGIGTSTPNTLFANNSTNTLGTDATGLAAGSLNWSMNSAGYAAGIYNAAAASGGNGLAVKVAGTTANNKILDLSTGAQATLGTSVMVVRGDGNVGISNSNPGSKLNVDNTGTTASVSVNSSNAANVNNVIEAFNANATAGQTSGNGGGNAVFARKGAPLTSWLTNPSAVYATSSDATGIGLTGLTSVNIGTFGGSITTGVGVLGQSFGAGGIAMYGIATNAASYALATNGRVIIQGQGAANGNILGSDATGNATWRTPTSLGLVGGTGTLNFVPKWTPNGTTLGNSQIFDNGTSVGIATAAPVNKLDVTQTGTTAAGQFTINNGSSVNTAVGVNNNGIGSGVTIQLTNASNGARGVDVLQAGVGPGVFATSAGGNAVWGITSSISAAGVIGDNTFGEAVVGRNRGGNGVGAVVGRNDSSGYGVRGFNTKDGIGVFGQTGISGGTGGHAGRFENVNATNFSNTVEIATNGIGAGLDISMPNAGNGANGINITIAGAGRGILATTVSGFAGVHGITGTISGAGVIGDNTFGEAVVGRNRGGNGVGAVVGRNDSSGYGVRGFNTKDGIGVLGQAGISGGTGIGGRFENVNAANPTPVLQAAGNGTGVTLLVSNSNAGAIDLAIFRKSGNVARIDATGKGFFNGGTQTGGADVAEFFDVEGNRNSYEPGDVLVISQNSDRKVEKSSAPYSTLVSGVYATKPGLLLTEKDAVNDNFDAMVPMGVIGVIPTKVCLEGGAIKRGDLLVTSSIPGVAMKADLDKVKVGQVIGKALQDYNATETGKINVLVSVK
jgi:trimeric autotransporter adhesin